MNPIEVTWSGFRGFIQPTTYHLPRLTLLLGQNNVGKTSAYAPLLLLRQTLDARSRETALLSRGDLIDAGPFRDFVSNHDPNLSVRFRISIPRPSPPRKARSSADPDTIDLEFRSVDGINAFLARHRLEALGAGPLVSRKRTQPNSPFTVQSTLLPKAVPGRPTRELTQLRKALRQEQPRGFLIDGIGALILPRDIRKDSSRWAKVQNWYDSAYDLYELQQRANARINRFLRGISYIGPLRSLPSRTYHLAPEPPTDLGGVGENAPELLYRLRESDRLEIVDRWLETLGYGKLHFESLGDEYFQLEIEPKAGTRVNVADSGVGLSQVLPLLVQGALANQDSTIIAQQPEIHLNPAQQTLTTDFLIERATSGIRVIIESHSEHILLRLRRRIAEGAISSDDVAVYFVENSRRGTSLRKMELGSRGELSNHEWPVGFFEEQLDDAFALAMAQSSGVGS